MWITAFSPGDSLIQKLAISFKQLWLTCKSAEEVTSYCNNYTSNKQLSSAELIQEDFLFVELKFETV